MKFIWFSLTCLVLASGCSAPASESNPAHVQRSASKVEGGPELGLTIDLPDEWVTVDFAQSDWRKNLSDRIEENPEVAKIEPLIPPRPSDSPVKMVSFDVRSQGDGFTDNMNIVVLPVPEGITLDMLVDANLEQMEGLQARGTSFAKKRVTVGGDEAGLVTWGMESGDNLITMRTYFVMQGGKYFTITYSCLAARKQSYLAEVEKAMATVRFVSNP
ncbi:MAG: hypothetical protein KF812_04645 [Fimbriimonadaceae bacterium]|nr:hypothetical protein [Fimbriimonadaceae bacterium]